MRLAYKSRAPIIHPTDSPSPGRARDERVPVHPLVVSLTVVACHWRHPGLGGCGSRLAQESSEPPSAAGVHVCRTATTLDTVVVTANKRVENIRDVAASISVIGERQLENLGASSLADYAYPDTRHASAGQREPRTDLGVASWYSRLSSSASVATYIDEVPVGSSGIYQSANTLMLDVLPYDISRVEVLRGPQGTLYGAGAIGGLLKYVTRAPEVSGDEIRLGFGLRSVDGGGRHGTPVSARACR